MLNSVIFNSAFIGTELFCTSCKERFSITLKAFYSRLIHFIENQLVVVCVFYQVKHFIDLILFVDKLYTNLFFINLRLKTQALLK